MKRIVIYMDGGVIQNVVADEPIEIYVVDYDVEGVEEDAPFFTKLSGDDCMLFPVEPEIDDHATLLVSRTYQTA